MYVLIHWIDLLLWGVRDMLLMMLWKGQVVDHEQLRASGQHLAVEQQRQGAGKPASQVKAVLPGTPAKWGLVAFLVTSISMIVPCFFTSMHVLLIEYIKLQKGCDALELLQQTSDYSLCLSGSCCIVALHAFILNSI
jgi:Na+/alanine symporter